MAGWFGGKKDERPVDIGLASLHGKSEAEAVDWWEKRMQLIAAIPSELARVGAMTPQLRELSRLPHVEERTRLTRARLVAFARLPDETQRVLLAAREKAWAVDRGVLEADQKLVDEILPTLDDKAKRAAPHRVA